MNAKAPRYHAPTLLALVATVVVGILIVIVGALALQPDEGSKKDAGPKWIYGPRSVAAIESQPDVQVVCQAKTTSRPFANHEHANPGDLYVMTCRAVKASPTYGPEPTS